MTRRALMAQARRKLGWQPKVGFRFAYIAEPPVRHGKGVVDGRRLLIECKSLLQVLDGSRIILRGQRRPDRRS